MFTANSTSELETCRLNLNKNQEEMLPHGTIGFPCAGYSACYRDPLQDNFQWHWHKEFEMVYVSDGCLEFRIPSHTYTIEAGDCFIVNSNIVHSGNGVGGPCCFKTIVFSPKLIAGSETSVFSTKYLLPLQSSPCFTGVYICSEEQPDMAKAFCAAFDALADEPVGFEFIVRERLSEICLALTRMFESVLELPKSVQSQDNLRMRRMLAYIHNNYGSGISLPQIARAADIGERECLRCFQRTINMSPVQYLIKHRIMQAAEMLLQEPERSISDISSACGFDSPSNFAKVFRRFYKCSPRTYRKTNAG